MPFTDPIDKKLCDNFHYQKNKAVILKRKQQAYKTRDTLIVENISLTAQIDDLNAKLLTAVEGKRYVKPKSEIIDMEINTGNYTVKFE